MKSLIASLRTLVLPFGAGTGRRIVLDGVAGTIQVYNASNQLVLQIDDTGIRVKENGVDRVILDPIFTASVRISTGHAQQTNEGSMGASAAGSGSVGVTGARSEQSMFAPSMDSQEGLGLTLINWADPALAPLLKINGEQFDGTAPEGYLDVTAGGLGIPKMVVAADEYWIGVNHGSTGAPTMKYSLPRGIVDVKKVTADQTGITTIADLTGLSIAWTADATRRYRVLAQADFLSNTASDIGIMSVRNATPTKLKEGRTGVLQNIGQQGTATIAFPLALGLSGSQTVKLSAERNAGASTITMKASATNPAFILLEDIGAL